MRLEDVITDEDVARLLFQQTELNFAPGDRFLYSNSGYTLLAMVVKQVSGKTLPEFAKERIFDPLGMAHTLPGRLRYRRQGPSLFLRAATRPEISVCNVELSMAGPSGLFSTVGDLARWDENFYTGEVGGPALLAQMQKKGKLINGKEIKYASGLESVNTVAQDGRARRRRCRISN